MEIKRKGYLLILGYLGTFLMMIGVIVLLPLFILIFYPSEINLAKYFVIPSVITIFIGYLLSLINRNKDLERLKKYEDVFLLLLIWLSAILISAVPFYLTKEYRFSEAVFEMTSGYTTTGMSIYHVDGAPKIFLFFRSITHFFGGVGLVLVLTSTMSDKFGIQLYKSEGHNDRLLPNLVRSARFIFTIYSIYIIVGAFLYISFGMSPFDAFNHAISAVSTGGFSTQKANIAYYNNVKIEIVTIILMLLGATNFMIHLFLFRRHFKKALRHLEIKFLLIYGFIMTIFLMLSTKTSFRFNFFHFISTMSSTGFVNTTTNFINFSPLFIILTIIIMVIGGGGGSTAGGIKHYRLAIFMKSNMWHLKEKISSPRLIEVKYYYYLGEKRKITDKIIISNYAFISLYLLIILGISLIITNLGYDFSNASFEVSSLIGNSGLSIGIMTAPKVSNFLLWLGSITMLIGRLEIYPILFGLLKGFIDIKKLWQNISP